MNVKNRVNKTLFFLMITLCPLNLLVPSPLYAGVFQESKDIMSGLAARVISGAKYIGETTQTGFDQTKQKVVTAAPYVITGAIVGTTAFASLYILLLAARAAKKGAEYVSHEFALLFVSGYKQVQYYQSILAAQKDNLHSLYSRYLPSEDELLRDLKAYWDIHGPKDGTVSFHEHMKTMIRLDIEDIERMLQGMKELSKKWDRLHLLSSRSLFENAVQIAKKASGHYYDPIFKFENLTGPEYASMSRAFYMYVLSPVKTIPSVLVPAWWNYISEVCFMWTLQKKIYQLEAMRRVIANDSLKPETQHSDITHHIK